MKTVNPASQPWIVEVFQGSTGWYLEKAVEEALVAKNSGIPFFSFKFSRTAGNLGEVVSVVTQTGWDFISTNVYANGDSDILFKRV